MPERKKKASGRKPTKAQKPAGGMSNSTKFLLIGLLAFGLVYIVFYSNNNSTGGSNPLGGSGTSVNVIALNDHRCGQECDMSPLINQLKGLFPGMIVRELDVQSQEGQSIFEKTQIGLLPALLFEPNVKDAKGYSTISRFLVPAGDYLNLMIGANWDPYCDPTAEHCAEAKCAQRISCRQEIPGKLDMFVMSHCPYGMAAMDSMRGVLSAFSGELNFSLNYIADVQSGQLDSLHGPTEVADDMRELCAEKYYPQGEKYMEFIWCRNRNITSDDWMGCATDNGMDAAKIKACAEGDEGKQLLSANLKIAQDLFITGSPTFFVNNKKLYNAVDPADIQKGICGVNPTLKGCKADFGNQSNTTIQGSCE